MNNLCFIPAKGNSKRLLKKNLQNIEGKSLVVRAIEGAIQSECFDKVCVSSNDQKILKIAEKFGAVGVFRNRDMCNDDIRAKDVLRAYLSECKQKYDNITMLMPTNPLRTANHIIEAHKIFSKKKCITMVSVTKFGFSPAMAMTIEDGALKSFYSDKLIWERESTFPKYYHLNGAIFIAEYEYFLEKATFINSNTIPYIMDRYSSVDVDTIDDLKLAEFYFRRINDRNS